MSNSNDKRLFWACFIALVATAFGFVVRTQILDDWAKQFGLNETQKGEILGVWLWPFAISIVLFSMIIDRIGYGRAIAFAFVCHMTSAIVTICAPLVLADDGASAESVDTGKKAGYWMLYFGNFIGALGNGTVEAVINPVVATMFVREKTKWLNILHAGWPGGLVLGGTLAIGLGAIGLVDWQYKLGLVFLPVSLYALLMIGCKFPINERVAAGVSYKDMLMEAGILSAMIVVTLMVREIGTAFGFEWWVQLAVGVVIIGIYGAYVQSIGRAMFFFLVIIMIPLAITELGTDTWIGDLMKKEMTEMALNPGWVLVYTSFIMMVLRFFAGPIVHKLSPLGLLAVSAAIAAAGLVSLSFATGAIILAAATLYGFGKTFFWPTMLGVVSEQFPKGGALTLNMISGIGMLGVGIVGAPFLGNIQDRNIDSQLKEDKPALYQKLVKAEVIEEKDSVFGIYNSIDRDKLKKELTPLLQKEADMTLNIEKNLKKKLGKTATADEVKEAQKDDAKYQKLVKSPAYKKEKEDIQTPLDTVSTDAKKNALLVVAIFPVFMLICYLSLIFYFRMKGGYKAEVLAGHAAHDEEFTGGVEGPMEG